MENKLIWVLKLDSTEKYLDIELYVGRNKYTKSGLFSGPLRRNGIDEFASNPAFKFMCSLETSIQSGKNSYKIHETDVPKLFERFQIEGLDEIYCRLEDKKLHHVDSFYVGEVGLKIGKYERKNELGIIAYKPLQKLSNLYEVSTDQNISQHFKPKAEMHLFSDGKKIRGILSFWYYDILVPAHSTQEKFQIDSLLLFRNLKYEKTIKASILTIGGEKSIKNEYTFLNRKFFDYTLPKLLNEDIKLFWGKEKKLISTSRISCNISYGMDWFLVSGGVHDNNVDYTLSDLLQRSKGKHFVEIDNGILFLPDEIRKMDGTKNVSGGIKVPLDKLSDVIAIAEKFSIAPEDYLSKFMDFSQYNYSTKESLESTLKPYQKDGLRWIMTLYKNGLGGCLADDMGLGKTLQAISFICCNERNATLPVLIVVPKIVLFNWKNEFNKFAQWLNVVVAYGGFNYSQIVENSAVYITTYDTLINHRDDFEKIKFDSVILDESQFVKNFRTKRYRAIQKIKTSFMLALTGTPVENNIEELWSLFNLINPGLLGSNGKFIKKYGDVHNDDCKMNVLKRIVTPFILRRTKEEVLKDLPPKEEVYVYCEMDNTQRALYDRVLQSAQKELRSQPSRFKIKDNSIVLQALLYLREICSDPQLLPPTLRSDEVSESCKYELFKEYASRVMTESNKLIVYSMFPKTLRKLEGWCKKNSWKTFYIDGSISNRQEIVDEFENTNQGIFFISLKAGGVGLNLVSCQYVFIYDPWWNTAAEKQASNRVYRIGQEKPVFIYHFLIKDTIEERIYELQKMKERLADDILSNLDGNAKVSMQDLYKLLI